MPTGSCRRSGLLALAVGVAMVVAGCTTTTGSPVPGDGVLAVSNTSDVVVYVRFEEADGSAITYRVDPGAVGRAEAADPAVAPVSMQVLTAACLVIDRESDPALGQIVIGGRGTTSTAADDPEVLTRPLLPTDDAACP